MWLKNRSFVAAGRAARFAALLFVLLCTVALGTNSALAQTLTPLYSFYGIAGGQSPQAGVVADGAGNLYGATPFGGAYGYGVVFEISPSSKTETILHSFNGTDGAYIQSGLIIDPSGNLYGTTLGGGDLTGCGGFGCGVVFKLTPSTKSETVLHTFTDGADGGAPAAALMADSSFNLYGTTSGGGEMDNGTVFELVNSSGSYNTLNVLYSFPGSANGYNPQSNLIADSSNNLYGTTASGGGSDNGVVFKLAPPATAGTAWTETPIYSFQGGNDGSYSQAGLVEDAEGNLYGTTTLGGPNSTSCEDVGCGVVFKVTPSGTESVLYTFTGGSDGGSPSGGLIQDAAGNLYGVTLQGGLGYGVVYKITRAGTESVLYTFTAGSDGLDPIGNLIADASGNLYGATAEGGVGRGGTVFELSGTGFIPPSSIFIGIPGKPNCQGVSVSTLAQTYGGLAHAATSLGYGSVAALQSTVAKYCAQ